MYRLIDHCRWRAWFLVGMAIAGPAPSLGAHDIPDRSFDRALEVVVDHDRIHVSYHLSLTQLTLAEELLSLVGPGGLAGAGPAERLERYGREMAPLLARGLIVQVHGKEIDLDTASLRHLVEDHPRFQFDMTAQVDPADGPNTIHIEDTNFFLEKGRVQIVIRAASGCTLEESTAATELAEATVRSAWEMTPEEHDAARRATARWSIHSTATSAAGDARPDQADTPAPDKPAADQAAAAPAHRGADLTALLDRWSEGFFGLLLALAFFFGVAHAMTPGHGKTMVAAYLVGERGTLKHAVGLGLTTSLTHTGSVLGVAVLLWLVGPAIEQRIHSGFSLLSGVLVAGLGATLLVLRLRSRRRGTGIGSTSSDPCGQCSDHSPARGDASAAPAWAGLVTLGVSGGIVPCWDAVVLLLIATAQGQIGQGVFLLVSFSAGLATALVLVGVLAVKLRGFLAGRMGSGRVVQALPVFSAAAILAVGLYLCLSTLGQLPGFPSATPPSANRVIES